MNQGRSRSVGMPRGCSDADSAGRSFRLTAGSGRSFVQGFALPRAERVGQSVPLPRNSSAIGPVSGGTSGIRSQATRSEPASLRSYVCTAERSSSRDIRGTSTAPASALEPHLRSDASGQKRRLGRAVDSSTPAATSTRGFRRRNEPAPSVIALNIESSWRRSSEGNSGRTSACTIKTALPPTTAPRIWNSGRCAASRPVNERPTSLSVQTVTAREGSSRPNSAVGARP